MLLSFLANLWMVGKPSDNPEKLTGGTKEEGTGSGGRESRKRRRKQQVAKTNTDLDATFGGQMPRIGVTFGGGVSGGVGGVGGGGSLIEEPDGEAIPPLEPVAKAVPGFVPPANIAVPDDVAQIVAKIIAPEEDLQVEDVLALIVMMSDLEEESWGIR